MSLSVLIIFYNSLIKKEHLLFSGLMIHLILVNEENSMLDQENNLFCFISCQLTSNIELAWKPVQQKIYIFTSMVPESKRQCFSFFTLTLPWVYFVCHICISTCTIIFVHVLRICTWVILLPTCFKFTSKWPCFTHA